MGQIFSYHVYFCPRDGVTSEKLVAQVHAFMETQVNANRACGYRLLDMQDKASFKDLPDFHLIVDYPSEEDRRLAFEAMSLLYRDAPHAPLMSMVTDFKVAFSADVPMT